MAKKEKEVVREVKFEYCSELSADEYKLLRKHADFPKLSDEQIEFIFNKNGWRYCCKVDGEVIAMCRFLCDESSTLIITDIVVHTDWRIERARIPERLIGSVVDYTTTSLQPGEELQVILLNMDPWSKEQLEEQGYQQTSDVLCKTIS